ncbi:MULTISPECIES: NAD-dependent succinate-semialdehyde dehydrogenase [Aeromicrobium]|uniref:NAD-dependent succinate-semialdehyde dehydrogenase n=1 Tax=Aeromicrobium TaxID=2040 RepID=UPI0006FF8425|nr:MULTISPECIES: NAD-dependent succinate-semialdehyde dehydrogenase [Aeromicrobium]KQX74332.1 succinate-semialdehyde dehydrogenase [Aeromicrobium sp. Root472D3]MCL8252009.1 NAD-dependent succinate-semialdehyde dehydrogenase [Aeromicrobium fastidiosum]
MTSPTYQVTDPSTGEVLESFDHATDEQVQAALTASHAAYSTWKDVPIEERAVVVKRVAALFAERADELAAIATQEMGKPASEGVEEAEFCQAIFDYFADEGPGLTADQEIKSISGGRAVIQRLPVGPLLGVMPWNFPFYQIARFAAPNLMLGNTIILKHAESVPRSALAVEQIMKDAGLPEGAYVNVFATFDQVETIIADPRVAGVSLTGSERAGAVVAALAGKNLKKCVLELGGSDPMVVLDTDDLDSVVGDAWDYRTYNTGQACNSNKRMIVMDDLFDDFVAKITEKALAVESFSPLSSRKAAETLHEQVQDAVSKGATLHAGGVLSDGPDAHYSPAVLTGITKDMRAYSEELFGPVAVVYKVGSDDEALELANDTTYGLGGSVFSADPERARSLAQRLEVGMANVNTTAGEGADIPFGGVKRSGFGRELGPLGMDEFVNKRMFYVAD